MSQHLARIEEREEEVHAFNLVLHDEALQSAERVDERIAAGEQVGPLAGVPIALKDNLCTRGIPTTCSSNILDGWRPPYDATVVSRLADAGAVFVGKTNSMNLRWAQAPKTRRSALHETRSTRVVCREARRADRQLLLLQGSLRCRSVQTPAAQSVNLRPFAGLLASSPPTGL